MNRLIEYTVFSGFVTACRLATWPTSRSPVLVIATTDGVVRAPSWLGITTDFVVPRSIPIILLIAAIPPECFANSVRPHPSETKANAAQFSRPKPRWMETIHVECVSVKFLYSIYISFIFCPLQSLYNTSGGANAEVPLHS